MVWSKDVLGGVSGQRVFKFQSGSKGVHWGPMVSKMGQRVPKMFKEGFKVIQDNLRQYQGLVAFSLVTS